ncbi:MAG: molybdopterin converting factor subunit 1 [Pseudomonadota bacterium]
MIKILFFASLRDQLACESASLCYSQSLKNIQDVIALLSERGEIWHKQLNSASVKVAVNQEMADLHTAIKDNDEIAFFPPVTGG